MISAPQTLGIDKMRGTAARGERWYVVHTQPHAEARAITNLEHQAYDVFCPRVRKTVRHARKFTYGLAPLFPNYLFIHIDVSYHRWRSINGTRGVVRLIAQGDVPLPVPKGTVEALRARMDLEGAMNWASSLELGQSVRVSEGPFENFLGTLESLDGSGRVRVLLDLLGRSVSVALRGEVLIPVA